MVLWTADSIFVHVRVAVEAAVARLGAAIRDEFAILRNVLCSRMSDCEQLVREVDEKVQELDNSDFDQDDEIAKLKERVKELEEDDETEALWDIANSLEKDVGRLEEQVEELQRANDHMSHLLESRLGLLQSELSELRANRSAR